MSNLYLKNQLTTNLMNIYNRLDYVCKGTGFSAISA